MTTATTMRAAIAAAILFALAWPGASHAQTNATKLVLYTGAVTDSGAVGTADSTDWKGAAKFQRMYLFFKPSRPGRYAIAVYTTDTTAAAADTNNTAVWPWRSASNVTPAAQDSMVYREAAPNPSSVAFASYEMVAEFPDNFTAATGRKWGSPRGRLFALRSPETGEWLSAKNVRFRFRNMASDGVVLYTAALHGFAW